MNDMWRFDKSAYIYVFNNVLREQKYNGLWIFSCSEILVKL